MFDIGNSNIVSGIYAEDQLIADWRLATDREKTVDEYGILLQNLFYFKNLATARIKAAVISSVVPPLTNIFAEVMTKYFKITALVVGPGIKPGCPSNMKIPGK